MKYSTGLSVSLAVLLTGFFTWGVSTDPEGWGGLIRNGERPDPGGVPLAAVGASSAQDDALTYSDLAKSVAQPPVFHLAPPPPESITDEFRTFLGGLTKAIQSRDIEAVLATADDDILLSFGYGDGREGLRALLSSPDLGPGLWLVLEDLVALPIGKSTEGNLCAPHFSCMALPPEAGIIDPFDTVFAIDEGVSVHATAEPGAEEVEQLSFDAVRQRGSQASGAWIEVELSGGRTGFVPAAKMRGFFDLHIDFDKTSGGWRMVSFVVGS